ncbi:MAG TPA: PASTA domain-containing protein [Acidimicrobiales bacterium]|nr:PASTA domain-containing protein [Acidimicrobiales bacterium]
MSTTTESIGRVLAGRYRIESALGTGASAHVFRAWDVSLRRWVAIKVLHPALAGDGAFLRRFRSEAQSAAALTHHNVLSVYDWGEDERGPFLVLEYLGGGSLRDMFDAGRHLSVSQAVEVGIQAAEGLAYAHGRGFVHRDIKPANLLFDEEGSLRIADFGLARALSEASVTEPAGATVGTARYAAPEQALGHLVDGRADVYALALSLYESVTGVVPFTADTTISTLMARVGAGLPPNDLLGPLGPVLEEAAAPEPDDRIDAARLSRSLAGLTRKLRPPKPLPLVGASGAGVAGRPIVGAAGGAGTDRTEHGMTAPLLPPQESGGLVGAGVASGAPPAGAAPGASDTDTSQMLAMASAVGVATEAFNPEGGPLARLGLPGGAGAAGAPPIVKAPPRRARRWLSRTAIVVLVVALVGGGLSYLAISTKLFVPSHRLPRIVGLGERAAAARLRPDQLQLTITRRRSSVSVPKGSVIRQIPAAGTPLKEGSEVKVVLSSGPPPVAVPSLANVNGDCTTVVSVLARAHLHADCTSQYDAQVPAGGVISWNPKTTAPEYSTIKVVISLGPPIETIPSLTGSTCSGATSILQAAGLVANCVNTYTTSGTPVGQVIPGGWNPSGSAPEGTKVDVQISQGPPPVTVPNVEGDTVPQAIQALQGAGLTPVSDQGNLSGHVFDTNPAPGTSVPQGTQVTLYSK